MRLGFGGAGPLLVLLGALGLAGCPGGDERESPAGGGEAAPDPAAAAGPPVRGDWMVQWLLADPESLNPVTQNDSASSTVLAYVMSTLLTLHPETLELVPVVAEARPEVAQDHRTYRFRIRDDVTFADGTPLTVEDVLFSLKVVKNPEVNAAHARNYYLSIVAAEAVDDRTVEFRASEPYFRNELVLGTLTILPRHFYDPEDSLGGISVADLAAWDDLAPKARERARHFAERFNRDFHRRVLGSSGYVLADPGRDLVTGEKIVLSHRDDFWAPGDALRGDGWVEKMVFRVINNVDAALVSLKAGNLDLMTLTPLQHTKQTGAASFERRFAKEIAYQPGYTYLGWNQRRPLFADRELRIALSHFVDRERLIEKLLFGFGEIIHSPVYRFRPEYDESIPGWPYDPKRGAELLTAAGWTDADGDGVREKEIDGRRVPLRFEIVSNSGNAIRKQVGLAVVDAYRRAGVAATFRELDWSILLQKINNFDYDAVIIGWAMSVTPPDLYQIFHSSQAVPGGSNHIAFTHPEVDRILERYRREFDPEKRVELYGRLQQILHEEAPYTYLFMQKSIFAYDRRFRDTRWYPTGTPLLTEWWVPKASQKYGN